MLSLVCKFTSHRINRNRVWFDEIQHRTSCDRCGIALIRDARGWRPFDTARDADPRRAPHPNAGD